VKSLKKYILLISIILLFLLGTFIYKKYNPQSAQIKESHFIIEVNPKDLTKTSEESVLSFYESNKADFKTVADYLLASEKLFGTRPVIINESMGEDVERIDDETIRKIADKLLKDGLIKQVASLNDDIKDVRFLIDGEYGTYEQGIRYVSDIQIISHDKTTYNHVKYYKDLGSGWFYYLYYYNKIEDADSFRKVVWDTMSENDKKSVTYDWHKAVVTLVDWNSVGHKKDNSSRKFVVSVCFNTEADGILGPIVVYLDPLTKEVVGGELRY
jgi:hypothetical protein